MELSHGYAAKNITIKTQYKTEIFPDNYTVFRNDRSSWDGGVFVAVQSYITAVKCVDFVTEFEIDFVKGTLKARKEPRKFFKFCKSQLG